MSQENVEIVRCTVDAWNREDLQFILERLSPDFECQTVSLFPGIDSVYHGPEGWKRLWDTFREVWVSIRMDLERVEDLGEEVLALFTYYGQGRASGVEVALKMGMVFTAHDGLIVRLVSHGDWGSTLEAVGLGE